ncbi:cytochrome b/b6 domain-containing protein [Pseudoalteromonas luteoviolacea]|uniref:Cytochrome b561 bacterial/Ni-hydrogenase domain-containing protein n=1 Tax=Pseudoalteromonas luteoviolacea DSM 6061 TaxID=1365250 RepID=A0A166VZ64_9GAMM|nr:cytochrome b/b6 domain-containing protein [Pseudoalteromonas luteoviolacea]KZN34646.1 hypothetical protein N475_19070 [Pseudoalteromonas luteoviolacea DSM 6061]MBE0389635.1 hypothetical protein [Pseudoalteromonas luteoviolacea DSM 6061]
MKVWDLATRIYHWLQALLFILLVLSGFKGTGPHEPLGILLFTLIVWRLLWGVVGSESSRFGSFIKGPKTVIQYLLGRYPKKPGHNPAGGWMAIAMIAALFIQCITGIIMAGLISPLENLLIKEHLNTIGRLHDAGARLLLVMVTMHVGAIIVYKLKAQPLVKAMFSGIQQQLSDTQNLYFVSMIRAVLVLIVSGAVTTSLLILG